MLNRIIKNGWTNFLRNSYMSIGTTGVMALALLLFMGLLGVQFLSSEIVNTLQDKVDISVYFKNDAPEDQILKVKDDVSKLPETESVEYISKDQALEAFKKRHANDDLIQQSLNQLDTNPLSASINIKAHTSAQYATIAQFLENSKFRNIMDKINFYENKGVIDRIESISQNINSWGLLATIALAFIAVLVTFNTIRLTIYNQRREIEIMRLVGASNWQVRGPYLVEGAFYGLFSAFISLCLFYPIVYLMSSRINSFTSVDLFSYFVHGMLEVVFLAIFIGTALGVISSAIAIRRHLKI